MNNILHKLLASELILLYMYEITLILIFFIKHSANTHTGTETRTFTQSHKTYI